MKKVFALLLTVLLSGCAALPAEDNGADSVVTEGRPAGQMAENAPKQTDTTILQEEPAPQNARKVMFSVEQLRNDPIPVLNVPHTIVDTVSCGEHVFTIYRLEKDPRYYLFVTVDGIAYDLGAVSVGDSAANDMESFKAFVIRLVQLPSSNPVYMLRSSEYMLVTTTYFVVQDGIPAVLYSMEDLRSGGSQYDIDLDGEEETICNHGGSTSPNEWLYEWDLTAGEVHVADLREQLDCYSVVYDAEKGRIVADTRLENGWSSIEYLYRDGCLIEAGGSTLHLQG